MALNLQDHLYHQLRAHIGHKIVCVGYGGVDDPAPRNVAIECETCGCVLLDDDFGAEVPSLFELRNAGQRGSWDEHPDHPVCDWEYEVAHGDTRRGYWEWVQAQVECALDAPGED